jgi:crotonobetainyl-CoA:carnitine CoA-transferase CaiB-like acyl-CoA transferase
MKLEGLRVLDLSLFLPGPLLTQMMADHGAEVIKLEPIGAGEPNREIGPKRDGMTVYFANTHRNKKSIQLNLKTEEGRKAALDLAATCDVMIEAFRPGVVTRLGVGYEAVRAVNPGIVYCSMSAWGQDGPYAQRPAHDLACEAIAGILSINQGTDAKPAIPGIAGADMLSSMMTLSALLMALYRRTTTGIGDYIDVSMADSLIASVPNNMGSVFADKMPPKLSSERALGGYAMYQIYETRDERYIALGGSEIHFAEAILDKLGRPDLLELCKSPPGPSQDPVKQFLAGTFKENDQSYWVEQFEGVNAAFAPVKNLREAADDIQIRHREMIVEDADGLEHIGIPMKFRHEPGELKFNYAKVGQHTREVLSELGYSSSEQDIMRDGGVF